MELKSMIAFVLEQRMESEEINTASLQQIQNNICFCYDRIDAYAKFLTQPLTLGMFILCNKKGQIIKNTTYWINNNTSKKLERKKFGSTVQKVLFKNFKFYPNKGQSNSGILKKEGSGRIWGEIKEGEIFFKFSSNESPIVEDLLAWNSSIELSSASLKQIGINE